MKARGRWLAIFELRNHRIGFVELSFEKWIWSGKPGDYLLSPFEVLLFSLAVPSRGRARQDRPKVGNFIRQFERLSALRFPGRVFYLQLLANFFWKRFVVGHLVHQGGNVFTKTRFQFLQRNAGVFNGVMEKSGHHQ